MRYTEGVYKRKRNGKFVYDGVLAYYDDRGKCKFAHRERKTNTKLEKHCESYATN